MALRQALALAGRREPEFRTRQEAQRCAHCLPLRHLDGIAAATAADGYRRGDRDRAGDSAPLRFSACRRGALLGVFHRHLDRRFFADFSISLGAATSTLLAIEHAATCKPAADFGSAAGSCNTGVNFSH